MRRTIPILAGSLVALSVGVACSEATRYRVLNFFLDGVPRPDASLNVEIVTLVPAGPGTGEGARRAPPKRPISLHPPYAAGQCDGCHDMFSGQLRLQPEAGLCVSCHTDPPGDALYVHGPVAVSACLHCHLPHSSVYPKLLIEEAPAICLQCHGQGDLLEGPHHATMEDQACTFCHNPHGGSDRFFLKRSGP